VVLGPTPSLISHVKERSGCEKKKSRESKEVNKTIEASLERESENQGMSTEGHIYTQNPENLIYVKPSCDLEF